METGSNSGLAEYPSDHIDFDTDLVGNDAEYSINKLAIWSARLMKAVIMFPIQTVLIYFVGRAVPYKRLTRRFT